MKYVHIMPHRNAEHNGSVIRLINDNHDIFNKDEHLFVALTENVYNNYSHYDNVIFSTGTLVEELNKYSDKCDYIFLHALYLGFKDFFKLKKEAARKIIWIVWTFDLYVDKIKIRSFRDVLRKVRATIVAVQKRYYVRMFQGIGIGFKYDAFEIVTRFGTDVNIYKLSYGFNKGQKELVDNIIEADNNDETDKPIKIMVGHSAYRFLNHYKIMDMLKRFKDENILLSVVVSYGDNEYSKELAEKAKQMWGDKVEIIDKYMDMSEYLKYLNSVDIAIIDYPHQIALGNIHRLMYMGKKIFLSKDGFLKKAYTLEGIKTFNINEIENMSFEEFISKDSISDWQKIFATKCVDETEKIRNWKDTIDELERQ